MTFFLYKFSLAQISSPIRAVVLILVSLFPLGLILSVNQITQGDVNINIDLVQLAVRMIFYFVIPVIALLVAIPAFSHEIDDRTLSYITLSPIERWRIVAAKTAASFTLGLPFALLSIFVALPVAEALELVRGDSTFSTFSSIGPVILGSLLGLAAYNSVMVWVGMKFTRPFAVALIYIFLWELGLSLIVGNFLGGGGGGDGFGYVTVIGQMSIISNLAEANTWVALAGIILVFIVFSYVGIRRMKTMDVS